MTYRRLSKPEIQRLMQDAIDNDLLVQPHELLEGHEPMGSFSAGETACFTIVRHLDQPVYVLTVICGDRLPPNIHRAINDVLRGRPDDQEIIIHLLRAKSPPIILLDE